MKSRLVFLICLLPAFIYAQTTTLVFIRHGEKPADGIGQLSCKGLQRALKIPTVLANKFGKPDLLFAPNPTKQKTDKGVLYNYIRPLASIEPTAVKFEKTVNLSCGWDDSDCLSSSLLAKEVQGKTVFVAWEHHLIKPSIEKIARKLDTNISVPGWGNDDFDSIYVVKIIDGNVSFTVETQGLKNLPKECEF